jgi:hypothetical protein
MELGNSACANVPLSGDYTIDSTATGGTGGCTFANTVDGVENGNLTIAPNQTLTVNSGQIVVWNPGKAIYIDGYIAINKTPPGGQLKKGYICAVDSDSDGYYSRFDFSSVSSCTSTFGGASKRRSELTSWPSTFDCLDSGTGAQYVYQTINSLVIDADHDSYQAGVAVYSSVCVGTSTTIAGRTYYMSTSSQYIWLPYSLANGSIDVDDSNDCIDTVTHECCDATNPTDGNRPAKTAQCLTSCKKCNGTSIDSINVTAGYVCTGSGTESLPSTSVYCATAAANLNACQYVTYYRSCDGSGSCRTDNTGAASSTTTCGPGYATLSKTSCTSVTTGNYCTLSYTCVDLDNDGETETRRTNYYGCAGSGSTCETTIRAYSDTNCCTSAGKYCSSGSCTGSLCRR